MCPYYYSEYSLLLSVLKMASVESQNIKYNIFIKAITPFYSRIVLTKLSHNQTVLLRKLEKEIKSNMNFVLLNTGTLSFISLMLMIINICYFYSPNFIHFLAHLFKSVFSFR